MSMNQVDLPASLDAPVPRSGCKQVACQWHRQNYAAINTRRGLFTALIQIKPLNLRRHCKQSNKKIPTTPSPPPTVQAVPLKGETFPQTVQPNKIMSEPCYTVVAADDDRDSPTQQDLKSQLENGRDDQKIETMKKVLTAMLNGDPMPGLLMHVIRFVTPSKNKTLKKLCLLYWEICPKLQPNGKLKQEMVLVWYVFAEKSVAEG
jgi:hypothetical protein